MCEAGRNMQLELFSYDYPDMGNNTPLVEQLFSHSQAPPCDRDVDPFDEFYTDYRLVMLYEGILKKIEQQSQTKVIDLTKD